MRGVLQRALTYFKYSVVLAIRNLLESVMESVDSFPVVIHVAKYEYTFFVYVSCTCPQVGNQKTTLSQC